MVFNAFICFLLAILLGLTSGKSVTTNKATSRKTSTAQEDVIDRPLRIAQLAPLAESVPPKMYGGTERVVYYLTEELVRQGHNVTLFASYDSETSAQLVSDPEWKSFRLHPNTNQFMAFVWTMEQVHQRAHQFDIIHCHSEMYFFLASVFANRSLCTLHGVLSPPSFLPVYKTFSHVPMVSISDDQRTHLPAKVNFIETVYHGVPADLLQYKENSTRKYLAFLGRITPDKRPDWAIEIAVKAGIPLKIAAKVDPVDQKHWDQDIKPLVDKHSDMVEYIGEITEQEKSDFLGDALALLFPIDWDEPFGLVMIEAMACGTPVIARRRGSVPEVIEEGVTGFIIDTVDEAVAAIPRLAQLDRAEIRNVFDKKFTAKKMAQNYVRTYRELLSKLAK